MKKTEIFRAKRHILVSNSNFSHESSQEGLAVLYYDFFSEF
jgi:hypothetical protein